MATAAVEHLWGYVLQRQVYWVRSNLGPLLRCNTFWGLCMVSVWLCRSLPGPCAALAAEGVSMAASSG